MAQSVLIIDDSPEIHELVALRLRPEGLLLHHALDAREGIQKARELQPDLILLDLDMPNVSGFEACRGLKSEPQTAALPVIFLTAASELYTKVEGFDLGAVDYVTKPFEPAELRARVRAALRTKRYQDLLATRAQVDALTSLWNRAHFDQYISREVAAVRRYGRTVSLVMLDVDHFKSLNDVYGHPFGDLVLTRIGEVLWATLRVADAPCRYGGEEFAIILTETDLNGARLAAERIRARLAETEFVQRGKSLKVTASFGVASSELFVDPQEVSSRTLVELADRALYQAKRDGRDRICVASSSSEI